jgi:hypothetical protein
MTTANKIKKFDDLISEKALMELTGYTRSGLKKLRQTGVIKNVHSINGRKLLYSKSELATLLNLAI